MNLKKNKLLFHFYLVLVFFCISIQSVIASKENFLVFTVATYWHPNLDKLLESCKLHDIDLKIVALGRPYYGNATKLTYFKEYIDTLSDHDIVMYVDAFDVLILADKKDILKKFFKMKTPFLMSAETNCGPFAHLSSQYPPSPTKFKYINTGSFIGYAKNIKKWLNDLPPFDLYDCDQGETTKHYLNSKKKPFKLDYTCQIFLPLFGLSEEEVIIEEKKARIICVPTKSTPCVLHANGASFWIWQKVYEKLINKKNY
jgi:hypothetical protein